jgi:hypothetical protein
LPPLNCQRTRHSEREPLLAAVAAALCAADSAAATGGLLATALCDSATRQNQTGLAKVPQRWSNIVQGASGNDDLYSFGTNTFLYNAGFGLDDIFNFDADAVGPQDLLQFDEDLFSNDTAVLSASTQVGADVVIRYDDNNQITLHNVQIADLASGDNFIFA